MISVEQAFQLLADDVFPLPTETVDLVAAVGRVLAADIPADVDSPPHKKSVMDGFAIRSEDLDEGRCRLKVVETIVAGGWPQRAIATGEAARIMTGAPLPSGADAVVMVELSKTEVIDDQDWVVINADSIQAGKHTMDRAANFSSGEILFHSGHRLRPTDIGLLAEIGAQRLLVGRKPAIAILPTGDELVSCDQRPGIGQIRNSNGPMLFSLAKNLGLETTDLGIGRDNRSDLESKIHTGLKQDVLILSGGVSAGLLDLVPGILKNEGVEEVFHQVKIKPGKPIWFGVLNQDDRRCYVFGLPGNPVSSLVGFHLFVRTAVRQLERDPYCRPKCISTVLAAPHETRGDRPTYWPGRWSAQETPVRQVEPLLWRGSSDLRALGTADGFIFFDG